MLSVFHSKKGVQTFVYHFLAFFCFVLALPAVMRKTKPHQPLTKHVSYRSAVFSDGC